jgi:hypothetical protein
MSFVPEVHISPSACAFTASVLSASPRASDTEGRADEGGDNGCDHRRRDRKPTIEPTLMLASTRSLEVRCRSGFPAEAIPHASDANGA